MNKTELVKKVHAKNKKIVLAIAGGGGEVIGELLRHGQGSNTLLEAIVPYCQKSYEEFIGGAPDKFVSEEAAAQLAMAAWQRARKLQDSDDVTGIGCTCALAKENEREGREHRVWIARQNLNQCVTLGFNLAADRETEETAVADAILHEVANACDIHTDFAHDATTKLYTIPVLSRELYKGAAWQVLNPDQIHQQPKLILPGSFNPVHNGHILMAKIAKELCPKEWCGPADKVHFELSVKNVDKPWLTYKSVHERTQGFNAAREPHQDFIGSLILTNAPLFIQKAEMFPGCIFVVGYDTFLRINTCKYYKSKADMNQIFDLFHENGVKWIVFPRKKTDGAISSEGDIKCLLNLPGTYNYHIDCPVFIVPNDRYPRRNPPRFFFCDKEKPISPMFKIHEFLEVTRRITLADMATGHGKDYLLRNTTEELGEYCAAVTISEGIKNKPLKETPRQEAVDLIICALSLFYAEGGTDEELADYGMTKLQKWADRIPSYHKPS